MNIRQLEPMIAKLTDEQRTSFYSTFARMGATPKFNVGEALQLAGGYPAHNVNNKE